MVDSRLGNFGPEYDNIDIHSFCDYASASSKIGGSDVPYCNYEGESVVLNDELNCNNKYCPKYKFLKTTKDISTFHGLKNTLDSYKMSKRVEDNCTVYTVPSEENFNNPLIVVLNGYEFHNIGEIHLARLSDDEKGVNVIFYFSDYGCMQCLVPIDMVESMVLKSVNSLDNWG